MGLASDLARLTAHTPETVAGAPGHFIPSLGKLPDDADDSFVATIAGVPVGFQFATWMGMDGAPALVLDILTDPTTFLSGVGALTKTGRAAKVIHGSASVRKALKSLRETRELTSGHLYEAAVRGAETAGRADAGMLHLIQKQLRGATVLGRPGAGKKGSRESIDAKARLKKLAEADQEARFAGMKGRGGIEVKEQLTIDPEIKLALNAIRADGVEGAQKQVMAEIGRRAKVKALAAEAKKAPTFKKFREIARELRKLEPSMRSKVLLSERRMREMRVAINQLERTGEIPRLATGKFVRNKAGEITGRRGAAAAQMGAGLQPNILPFLPKVGQRALLRFTTPFGEVTTGRALASTIDRVGGKMADAPFLRVVLKAGRVAGMVPGARTQQVQQLQKRSIYPETTAPDLVEESMVRAANSLTGVPLDSTDFTSINRAWNAERSRTEVWASDVRRTVEENLSELGFSVADRANLNALIDDPARFLGASSARAATNQGVFRGASLNKVGAEAGISPAHLELAERITAGFSRAGEILQAEGAIATTVRNYMPRQIRWIKNSKEARRRLASAVDEAVSEAAVKTGTRAKHPTTGGGARPTSTFFSHGRPRVFKTLTQLERLEKSGLIEIERDPSALLAGFFEEAGRSVASARFLKRMARGTYETAEKGGKGETLRLLIPVGGKSRRGKDGERQTLALPKKARRRLEKAGYVPLGKNTDDKGVVELANEIGRQLTGAQGAAWRHAETVWMPEEFAKPLTSVIAPELAAARGKISEGFGETALRNSIALNGILKRSLLMISAFHHMALTESAVAVMGGKFFTMGPRVLGKRRGQLPERLQGAQKGGSRDFFEATDVIETGLRHGLQLGRPIDPQLDAVQRAINWANRTTSGKSSPMLNPLGRALGWYDRGLWDYYHNGMKIMAFNEISMRALARPRYKGQTTKHVLEGVADHINNAFGGQAWNNMFLGRRGQQIGRFLIMAPDWTISNLRIATDIFANRAKRWAPQQLATAGGRFPVTTSDLLRMDVRATFARQYALRATILGWLGYNAAQYALTSFNGGDIDFSKGHYMDQNAPGFRTMMKTGFKDAKGREIYSRMGKQFREPAELFESMVGGIPLIPSDFMRRKMAPVPAITHAFVFNKDIFGGPIVETDDGVVARIGKSLNAGTLEFAPIAFQQLGKDKPGFGVGDAVLGASGLPLKRAPVEEKFNEIESGWAEATLKNPAYRKQIERVQNNYQEELAKALKARR